MQRAILLVVIILIAAIVLSRILPKMSVSVYPSPTVAATSSPTPTPEPKPTPSQSPKPTATSTPKPPPNVMNSAPGARYYYATVHTEKGDFTARVLSIDLTSARMITDT